MSSALIGEETWIENWPPALAALSFPHLGIGLSAAQVHAIGRANGIDRHCFEECGDARLAELARILDEALRGFARGACVRLGSRSPKDTPAGLATGCRATTGLEAIGLLTSGSRRIAFDLPLPARPAAVRAQAELPAVDRGLGGGRNDDQGRTGDKWTVLDMVPALFEQERVKEPCWGV